jgi:hypothetical protein
MEFNSFFCCCFSVSQICNDFGFVHSVTCRSIFIELPSLVKVHTHTLCTVQPLEFHFPDDGSVTADTCRTKSTVKQRMHKLPILLIFWNVINSEIIH